VVALHAAMIDGEAALKGALAATNSIDHDPIERGCVTSLARPSGNITGPFFQQIELARKRIEFVREAFPDLRWATVIWDMPSADQWRVAQKTAPTVNLGLPG
jgi:hypothetical protein